MIFIIILGLMILFALFMIGLRITGALLRAGVWLFICVPIGLALILVGIVLCCTIIFIPVGRMLMGMGFGFIARGFWI